MQNTVLTARIKTIFYKCALYGAALFLVGVMQVSFFSKINVLGAPPDLLLGAVLTLAMVEDHKVASVCGIIAGFFYCALGGFSYPIYMVFSFLCGYILWGVSERTFSKNYPSFLALAAITYAAKALFNIFETALSSYRFSFLNTVGSIAFPEFVSSMLFCSLSYLIFRGLSHVFNKKSKHRKERSVYE